MVRLSRLPMAVGLALFLALPGSARAQHYAFGAGLGMTDAGISGQHLFAAILVPTSASTMSGRLEGFLRTADGYGTSFAATANLQFTLLPHTAVSPYLLGGGGVQFGAIDGIVANAGFGITFARPLFLELVLRTCNTTSRQNGFFALSLGTTF